MRNRINTRRSTLADRGLAQRDADAQAIYRATKDPRKATAAYCVGNRWLEENAKAVGNWPRKV